ncbi:BatD family protein [Sedimenticola thiotaurini]|uniref:DUF7939 domain-containing protein n=1 Tax=Sedimenticola thiotaurini TaxID=1543721 RepID=A0A0F7JYP6_9GAMM|nr:BatD family protein [Sedimenticola thiotaurini]AKH21461.1 hypothetical protein AAY24_15125 [Sedimenticola thiotaurini]
MTHRLGYVALLLILLSANSLAATGLSARLDRDRISEGETVQLILEAPGQVAGRPDTAPLEKTFDVLGISSGSRIQIINGKTDARTTWTLTLSPKQPGKLTIPPLRIGNRESQELLLEVTDAPVADSTSGADILIESELSPQQPYVQGQVLYNLRLLHAVPIQSGTLSDPKPDNTLVQRLGEERNYSTLRHGRRYQVIERRYALFPQKSGTLKLAPPLFDGEVPDKRQPGRSPFGRLFGQDPFFNSSPLDNLITPTRRVRIRGTARELQIQPRPGNARGSHWLPARQLQLHGSWSPDANQAQVGEPITLELELQAEGLTAGQLPDLTPAAVAGFDLYPDQAQRHTDTGSTGVTGRLRQKIAFLPKQPGKLSLPAIQLHWWDTTADQPRLATLPGREVVVTGAAPQPIQTPAVPALDSPRTPQAPAVTTGQAIQPGITPLESGNRWLWLSTLLASGWLVTLLLWWRQSRRTRADRPATEPASPPRAGTARRRFQSACQNGDPVAAQRALLDWAAAHWPEDPPRGLEALARRLSDPAACAALEELNRALYRERTGWNGTSLATALQQLPKPSRGGDNRPRVLPPLYPRSSS